MALLKEMQRAADRDGVHDCHRPGHGGSAVEAMRQGAYDYIEKPLNAEKLNRLKALIPKAMDKFNVQQKNKELASTMEGLTTTAS